MPWVITLKYTKFHHCTIERLYGKKKKKTFHLLYMSFNLDIKRRKKEVKRFSRRYYV